MNNALLRRPPAEQPTNRIAAVLVAPDSIFGRYLAAGLYQAGAIDRVILERGWRSWRSRWRKFRSVGPINAVFQFWWNQWFRREGARWLRYPVLPPHETVVDLNGYTFTPNDLVIGFGTSIVTARTLESLPQGFLNLHTGLLPDYRGNKPEYWAIAHGDTEKFGWTLHYLDSHLDNGDIVLQRSVSAATASSPQLRAILIRDAVPALAEFIACVRKTGFQGIPRRPHVGGKYFTTPTWRDWFTNHRALQARQLLRETHQ